MGESTKADAYDLLAKDLLKRSSVRTEYPEWKLHELGIGAAIASSLHDKKW